MNPKYTPMDLSAQTWLAPVGHIPSDPETQAAMLEATEVIGELILRFGAARVAAWVRNLSTSDLVKGQ